MVKAGKIGKGEDISVSSSHGLWLTIGESQRVPFELLT